MDPYQPISGEPSYPSQPPTEPEAPSALPADPVSEQNRSMAEPNQPAAGPGEPTAGPDQPGPYQPVAEPYQPVAGPTPLYQPAAPHQGYQPGAAGYPPYQQGGGAYQPYQPYQPYQAMGGPHLPVDPVRASRKRRMRIAVAASASLAAICAAVGIGFAVTGTQSVAGAGVALPSANPQSVQGPFGNGGTLPNGGYGSGGNGSGGTGSGSSGTSGPTSTGTATAAQSSGVVDIVSTLGYQQAEAAGTGTVVTSSGEVLTNNHVIDGATSIKVTVVSTGATYTASVVGTDPTDDVAVLQLSGASGLTTANFGNASSVSAVSVGDAVTGVGNAGGTGGTPSSATGQVTALNQTITASDSNGSNPETVTGMIETNAPIAAGDSGGPLYDSSGKIVGVDTAAQTGRGGSTVAAYAIPITKALSVASQIESGQASSTVHIGSTGFLGVSVQDTANGTAVASVVTGGPAAKAGLAAGDVITAVNGSSVTNSTSLRTALSTTKPGQQVTVSWTDAAGASHHATVTLTTGPAD
ncbi:MAG: hypothetical protein QOE97_3952 [Pseudonocardiales bacterium]|nr:hypothetical protein [Pseudonocardiales bacterium]